VEKNRKERRKRKAKSEKRKSKIENRKSKIENRKSKIENRKSKDRIGRGGNWRHVERRAKGEEGVQPSLANENDLQRGKKKKKGDIERRQTGGLSEVYREWEGERRKKKSMEEKRREEKEEGWHTVEAKRRVTWSLWGVAWGNLSK
jgi:hypothetical protein